jgi:hypothetical protein
MPGGTNVKQRLLRNLSSNEYSNPGPPEYESGMPATQL